MCEVTMIGLAVSIAATAAAGGIKAAAAVKASNAEADAARQNARLAASQRDAAIQAGETGARVIEGKGREASAAAVAIGATSGVSTASGSAAKAPGVSEINARRDADLVRAKAAEDAWKLDSESIQYGASARDAARAGGLGALSEGLAAGSSIGKSIVTSPAWGDST